MHLATFSLLPLILLLAAVIVLALLSCAVQDLAAWWCRRQVERSPAGRLLWPEAGQPPIPCDLRCPKCGRYAKDGPENFEGHTSTLYACLGCDTAFEWSDPFHWKILCENVSKAAEQDATEWQEGPVVAYWPLEPLASVDEGYSSPWDWKGEIDAWTR